MVVLRTLALGPENVGFTDKDAKNLRRTNKEKKKGLHGHMLFDPI